MSDDSKKATVDQSDICRADMPDGGRADFSVVDGELCIFDFGPKIPPGSGRAGRRLRRDEIPPAVRAILAELTGFKSERWAD